MITKDLLRAIRNDLPMKLTVTRLGRHGPISKQSTAPHQGDACFRFQCPHCSELRATVNPKNNLAHCFSCGENINNIDLMLLCGHDFLSAVTILESWLEQYRRDLAQSELPVPSRSSQP